MRRCAAANRPCCSTSAECGATKKLDRRHLSRASRRLALVSHRRRSRWRSTALRQSRSKPPPPISSPAARRNAHRQLIMDRHAPARDGSALLQRYCNESAIQTLRIMSNFAQVIDFIMGRDGFEPSTSGLKVPWAPDSFLALCFYWWAALGTETLAGKIQRIAEQVARHSAS